jgi:hypothetical protein
MKREAIAMEREAIAMEREAIAMEREAIAMEREAIAMERKTMECTTQNEHLNCSGLLCSERYQSKPRGDRAWGWVD